MIYSKELTSEDLVHLGVTRVGPRKQFQRKIAALKKEATTAFRPTEDQAEVESDSENSDSTGASRSRGRKLTSSGRQSTTTYRIKTTYEDRVKLISISNLTFDRLVKEMTKKWEIRSFLLFYIDAEGDTIEVNSDDDLDDILQEAGSSFKMLIRPKHTRNHITDAEQELLKSFVEPVFVFDKRGKVLFRNKAAEAIGATNIFQVLPGLDFQNYLTTGKSKQVGRRSVLEVRYGNESENREVTLNETKTKNRQTFTATVHDKAQTANAWNAMYDRVADGVVVINPHGTIQYVNAATVSIFGFKEADLVGQNVKKLMPNEDASRHDGYLRNYRRSGVAKVIGTGRRVVGQASAGQMIPLQLTLVEQRHEGDERFFIGMLRVLDVEAGPLRTMLQVERETIEALSAPAIIIDSSAIIVGLNTKVEQMFGYKYVELINKNVNLLMPADVAAKHDSFVSNYLKTGKSAM